MEPLTEQFREALRASRAVEYMWMSMPAIPRGANFDAYYDHVLRTAEDGEYVPFALTDPTKDNAFAGVTAFIEPNRIHRRINIGFTWLIPDLRGRGVYRSIQRLMIGRALDWGAKRIGWTVESTNERAIKAIKALGAIEEGVLRHYQRFADGQWVDVTVMSMLRDEAKHAVTRLDELIGTRET